MMTSPRSEQHANVPFKYFMVIDLIECQLLERPRGQGVVVPGQPAIHELAIYGGPVVQ